MNIRLIPTKLSGTIAAIPSKSFAHRLLIAAALADRPTVVHCPLLSKDIAATIGALTDLGAKIDIAGENITVIPIRERETPIVHCGESGTTARLLLPIAAALTDGATIAGEGSLPGRPFDALCCAMAQNGCVFSSQTLPVAFVGRLQPGTYEISGNISSQYISGLLMALPLLNSEFRIPNSELHLTSPLESSGYVDMTVEVLATFGITIQKTPSGYAVPGAQTYHSPGYVAVEGDWSNAAFWLAAGVKVTGLNENSLQKDRRFAEEMHKGEINAAEIPDLVPILAVYAAGRVGTTCITNIHRLRLKESDRVASVAAMLRALGGDVEAGENELIIRGRGRLAGGTVEGQNDHRIVMAAAIASCFSEDEVVITGAEAVEKSYPNFFSDFKTLGGRAYVI